MLILSLRYHECNGTVHNEVHCQMSFFLIFFVSIIVLEVLTSWQTVYIICNCELFFILIHITLTFEYVLV